jgi:hypothetical protein
MNPCQIRRISLTVALVLAAACWTAVPAHSQDAAAAGSDAKGASIEQDHKALQGRWERKLLGADDNARQGEARAVKEVKGNRETVTYYDDAGRAVRATTADFKLEQSGRVRLYTFSNLKVTLGADQGDDATTKPLSYIYRVDGDVYHEAHGLLVDSPAGSKPGVARWVRSK